MIEEEEAGPRALTQRVPTATFIILPQQEPFTKTWVEHTNGNIVILEAMEKYVNEHNNYIVIKYPFLPFSLHLHPR